MNDEILKDYYNEKLTVSSIVEKHSLGVTKSIFKTFPQYVHEGLECEYCASNLVSDFSKREERVTELTPLLNINEIKPKLLEESFFPYQNRRISYSQSHILSGEGYTITVPYCPSCKHVPLKTCSCDHCYSTRKENQKVIAEECRESYPQQPNDVASLEEVNITLLFQILLFLSEANSQEEKRIQINGFTDREQKSLIEAGLIYVDQSSVVGTVKMRSTFEYEIDESSLYYIINSSAIPTDNPVIEVKKVLQKKLLDEENYIDILELWFELTMDEALNVLNHYCDVYRMVCRPGEKTLSIIKKSLRKYGLAQTSRYIYNAVKRSQNYGLEQGLDRNRTFNLIYKNLCFWVDDDRAREWAAPPFNRDGGALSEPTKAIVFSHSFLDLYGIDYFKDPVSLISMRKVLTA